jgi:hypothetical protein
MGEHKRNALAAQSGARPATPTPEFVLSDDRRPHPRLGAPRPAGGSRAAPRGREAVLADPGSPRVPRR